MKLTKPTGVVTCVGDSIAKETWTFAQDIAQRFAKTKRQRDLLATVLPESNTLRDWWRVCKKDLSLFRSAAIRMKRGDSPQEVHQYIEARHGCLKTKMLRYLEWCYYLDNPRHFNTYFFAGYESMGMSKSDVKQRATTYATKLNKEFKR